MDAGVVSAFRQQGASGDEADKVAETVGNGKTKDECVMHFLQIPIEEPVLEHGYNFLGADKALPSGYKSGAPVHINVSAELPFVVAENPVMAQVSLGL